MTTIAINTPRAIIETAMRNSGRLAEGQTPNGEQYTQHLVDLQRLINLWQTQGLKLWLQKDITIVLVEGKGGPNNPYRLRPVGDVNMNKPLRIQQGYYLDEFGNQRPIYPLSWDEWMRLGNREQHGPLAQYFVDKQVGSLDVYFWLIPDKTAARGTAHLLTQQQVVNPVSLNEDMNFPSEWGLALVWGLADEISTGQPQTIMDRCQGRAATYRMMLEDWDVEDAATMFQPDSRQRGYGMGEFR